MKTLMGYPVPVNNIITKEAFALMHRHASLNTAEFNEHSMIEKHQVKDLNLNS